MKVDTIHQSTNFGMALRINTNAQKALENASLETIQALQNAGKELKDTKFCDLEIGENLTPRIDSVYANSYVPPFTPIKPDNNILLVETQWDGTELKGLAKGAIYHTSVKFENKEAALEAYNNIKSAHTNIEKATLLTKMIDNEFVKRDIAETKLKTSKETIKNMAKYLMEEFGSDTHKNEFKK